MKRSKHQKGNEQVVILNPETGDRITTTRKAFESLYAPKGYDMTDQDPESVATEFDDTPKPKVRGDESIVIKHRATGQVMETTIKSFETLYQYKGFEIVTRANIDGNGERKSTKTPKRVPVSSTGSAAAVAEALNLDKSGTQDLATPEATLPPAATDPENAIEVDTNNAVTPERTSNRRDRGRT